MSGERAAGVNVSTISLLWLVALIFFAPVLWIFLAAFKSAGEIVAPRPGLLVPADASTTSCASSRLRTSSTYLKMSFVLSIGSVLIAHRRFVSGGLRVVALSAGRHQLHHVSLTVDAHGAGLGDRAVPIFLMYTALGWTKTFHGMMLFYAMFSIPFSLWILKGFLDGVSLRYDETALVNGGSRLHIICGWSCRR